MSTAEDNRDVNELADLLNGLIAEPIRREIAPVLHDITERLDGMPAALAPISELFDMVREQKSQKKAIASLEELLERTARDEQVRAVSLDERLKGAIDALQAATESIRGQLSRIDHALDAVLAGQHAFSALVDQRFRAAHAVAVEHRTFAVAVEERLGAAEAMTAERTEVDRIVRAKQWRVYALTASGGSVLTTMLLLLTYFLLRSAQLI